MYVSGIAFIRYVSGITFVRYVSGITMIRYVSGITFITYVSEITFIRYVSGITFIRYAQSQKIGKPNIFFLLGAINPKPTKHDSHNCLKSHMSEGGEP